MKHAYAVIGANFGDEGKGLMTDYFCRQGKNSINVRTNGGAQAGHTVCTADGKRHIFSHFGAGWLAGADTYLSAYFLVNPMLYMREVQELAAFGGNAAIYADAQCSLTLPCDMLLNQYAERARGGARHGSCGLGIFETVLRSKEPAMRFVYGDTASEKEMSERIRNINRTYVQARAEELGITGEYLAEMNEILENPYLMENYLADLAEMRSRCHIMDARIIEEYDTAVFEGAQGLLLDENRMEYFPHLTPSATGMKNIRSILDTLEARETEVCYVTRSYFTRHGAGRFDTECADLQRAYQLHDKTNAPNEFQGVFRYGYFDEAAFMQSLALDAQYLRKDWKKTIAVTHLDETEGRILCPNRQITPNALAQMVMASQYYTAEGETAAQISAAQAVCEKATA